MRDLCRLCSAHLLSSGSQPVVSQDVSGHDLRPVRQRKTSGHHGSCCMSSACKEDGKRRARHTGSLSAVTIRQARASLPAPADLLKATQVRYIQTLVPSLFCAPFRLRVTARRLAGCFRPLPAPRQGADNFRPPWQLLHVKCLQEGRQAQGQGRLVSLSAVTIRRVSAHTQSAKHQQVFSKQRFGPSHTVRVLGQQLAAIQRSCQGHSVPFELLPAPHECRRVFGLGVPVFARHMSTLVSGVSLHECQDHKYQQDELH